MKKHILLGLALVISGAVSADSLWSDSSVSLFAPVRATKVGDILQIVVTETATAAAKADTKASKSESSSIEKGLGPLLSTLFPALGLSGKTGLDASGTTSRSDSLQARIAVTVKDVLPNGNLLVEGTRVVTINGEQRKLILTGMVRPIDVSSENTVPSALVANAEIKYDGKGTIGTRQRRGILSRIFEWLF